MLTAKLVTPLLFFLLGGLSRAFKSHLEVPQPIAKAMALFLLITIGLKGGVEINSHGLKYEVALVMLAGLTLSVLIPFFWFNIIRRKIDAINAAAIAATYGSVSAITFVTAVNFLDSLSVSFDGYLIAVMALMEGPPIVVGVLLAKMKGKISAKAPFRLQHMLHEAFMNQAVFVLIGCLIIGTIIGESGFSDLRPFFDYPFKGILCLFLLDMGVVVGRRLPELKKLGPFLFALAFVMPLINAAFGIGVSYLIGLEPGNALLLTVLAAGASYIAVPAALSVSLPEANQAVYISMSLAVTFPLNVLAGIPLYYSIINTLFTRN
ncbi:sodium-dependent bicarbonate transport family permease [Estrella lausannensis]|uniref:Permease n=1 Tax=Estrella lausannensis TaxID=483423 RepID=A0A0H5DPB0_9BACT|nr:sodium-dependent bicarbonate transport family permease [Estrella lausannensis]CRX38237.1 hypothetical protein ELAC_0888 [Estrella lausannensis]